MIDIGFKDLNIFREAFVIPWHPKLINLALWVYGLDVRFVLTSAYREGDRGVHGTVPLRGFDLRSHVIPNPDIIEEMTNRHWQYDPKRPSKKVCMLHDVGKGIHFHFQVHPKTIKISGSDI